MTLIPTTSAPRCWPVILHQACPRRRGQVRWRRSSDTAAPSTCSSPPAAKVRPGCCACRVTSRSSSASAAPSMQVSSSVRPETACSAATARGHRVGLTLRRRQAGVGSALVERPRRLVELADPVEDRRAVQLLQLAVGRELRRSLRCTRPEAEDPGDHVLLLLLLLRRRGGRGGSGRGGRRCRGAGGSAGAVVGRGVRPAGGHQQEHGGSEHAGSGAGSTTHLRHPRPAADVTLSEPDATPIGLPASGPCRACLASCRPRHCCHDEHPGRQRDRHRGRQDRGDGGGRGAGGGPRRPVAVVKPAQTGVDARRGRRPRRRTPAGTASTDLHEYARFPDPLSPAAAARRAAPGRRSTCATWRRRCAELAARPRPRRGRGRGRAARPVRRGGHHDRRPGAHPAGAGPRGRRARRWAPSTTPR